MTNFLRRVAACVVILNAILEDGSGGLERMVTSAVLSNVSHQSPRERLNESAEQGK